MSRWNLEVACLEETKMEAIGVGIVHSMWKAKEVGWRELPI